MVTTVVKSIGATGRDYSLPQSWENDRPADHTVNVTSTTGSGSTTSAIQLNAGASGTLGAYIGNTLEISGEMRLITAYNETTKVATVGSLNGSAATFTSAPGSGVSYTIGQVIWKGECYNDAPFTTQCIISGGTTSATCYAWLTAAAGESFIDHPNVRTNALAFNQANGVAFERASVSYEEGTIQALSAYTKVDRLQVKTNGTGTYGKRNAIECAYSGNGTTIRDCILEVTFGSSDAVYLCGQTITNCVLRSTGGNGVYIVDGGTVRNCTIKVGGTNCVYASYWYGGVYGCAMFGSSSLATRLTHTGAELSTGSYNGTDKSAAPGTSNQTSLTFGNCFESTTDLRLKAGSSLIGVGNTDATNAPNDITGRVRDAGTAGDIGAWEWSDPTLYGQLDETTASNTDYITTSTAGSMAELQLGSVTDPGVDTLISMKLRASGSGSLKVDLVQGSGNLLVLHPGKTRRVQQPQRALVINPALGADLLYLYAPWINPRGRYAGRILDYSASGITEAVTRFGERVGNFTGYGGASENLRLDIHYAYAFPRGLTFVFRGKCAAPWDGGWNFFDRGTGTGGLGSYGVGITRASGVQTMGAGQRVAGVDYVGRDMFINGKNVGTSRTHDPNEIINLVVPFLPPDGAGYYDTKFCVGPTSETSVMVVLDRQLSPDQALELSEDMRLLLAPEYWPQFLPAAKPIATRTIPLVATPTDYRRELLPAEAALITNYADLRVRFTGV